MTLTTSIESIQISMSDIDTINTPYSFRLEIPSAIKVLRRELAHTGQLSPVTLLTTEARKSIILDGHQRIQALRSLQKSNPTLKFIRAVLIPVSDMSPQQLCQFLKEKNDSVHNRYGLMEKGRFFKTFLRQGLSITQLKHISQNTIHDIMDLIEIADSPRAFAMMLNPSSIQPMYAAMLFRRYKGWMRDHSPWIANSMTKRLLEHAKNEPITMKSWRFLLDFYGGHGKPFLTSHPSSS